MRVFDSFVVNKTSTNGVRTCLYLHNFWTPLQVVVDVQDFINGGEVNVKVVNEREIVIEGHVEKKEGNTTSTKRFRKRYVLPEDIEVEKVTSVMSSDGVLTIKTPKKVSQTFY